jgi:hypothetical protein
VPVTRLLVIADTKMLAALANGLREGAKFDVQTVPLSDPAGAQAAAETAEAIAIFYGAPGLPLPAALQSLSPRVRERGGRVVAVLQREQAAQRDDCFRAGASDLLFMPMPKDQFVARLQASVDLSFSGDGGAPAPVAVATRTAASKVDQARVVPAGVEAPAALPVKAGDTVRLSCGVFQTWGLVVRPGPTAQIRFAGLAPDEEVKIRDWLKNGAPLSKPPASATPPPSPPPAETQLPAVAQRAQPPAQSAPPPARSTPPPPPPPSGEFAKVAEAADQKPTPPGGSSAARAAPAAGPPPGFADRKPIRPQNRTPPRISPPTVPPSNTTPPASTPAAAPVTPAPGAAAPPPSNGAPALARLFEEGGAAAPTAAEATVGAAALGPPWPVPVSAAVCKAAAMQLFKDRTTPADTPSGTAASARKITGMLSSTERTSLEKLGADSQFANVLATRIALDTATAEGVKLSSSIPAPSVDAAAVAALTRLADEAAAALQKEANAAVGKGEVESLQMVTAASAALSRDLLNFKETADRLRGISAAPRLGAGALDPDVVLPGQAPKPKPPPSTTVQPVKAELRDFQALDRRGGPWKATFALILILGFAAAAFNAFYLNVPHHKAVETENTPGVVHVDVSGQSALVTVTPEFFAAADNNVRLLANALRERGVKKAILMLPNGAAAGVVDVTTGRGQGLKTAPK